LLAGAKVQPAAHLKSQAAKAKIFYLAIETPKKAKVQCNWDLCKWRNKYIYTGQRADMYENFQHRLKNVNGIYAKLCCSNFERVQIFYAYAEPTLPIRRVCRQQNCNCKLFFTVSMPPTQTGTLTMRLPFLIMLQMHIL